MKGFGREVDIVGVDGVGVGIVTGELDDGRGDIIGTVTGCGVGGGNVGDTD